MSAPARLELRTLRPDDEVQARQAHEELRADDFDFLLFLDAAPSWDEYVAGLAAVPSTYAGALDPVPSAFLVGVIDGEIVGRVSVRFALNEWLAREGGHIGYAVRPAHRGRGLAGALLERALVLARENGVSSVLMVCDDDNVASARVIERAGGVLEGTIIGEDGVAKRRYWID